MFQSRFNFNFLETLGKCRQLLFVLLQLVQESFGFRLHQKVLHRLPHHVIRKKWLVVVQKQTVFVKESAATILYLSQSIIAVTYLAQ